MKNTKSAFTYFDEKGIPHFDFSSIIPMPKVTPPKQENSSATMANNQENDAGTACSSLVEQQTS